ncbi:ArsC family reductase [Altericroceibacterium endophyticum]|uniref:ArsC family reductase n=1 Tax=Altericroceibacterium endophyticum TaxID=1808508 RepID=A0A6I4T5D1_9SPHN|nr:ArsC family reductase [Altericroceibacterium endophyticum]MXO65412.1 ArsC family reductase [Altericroceibacterium endophyticum]
MTVTVYGIPNCDTMKKARKWLDEQGIAYNFHDYKKQGIEPDRLYHWIDQIGWEPLLNKRGTTFRKLPEEQKTDIDAEKAAAIMAEHTSIIKRPVVEHGGQLLVGFDEARWQAALA